nr:hypothetical protein [Tanacetum cinerariifolium]
MKSIETFLEKFNCIPFEEKPPILLQAWFKFFAIQYSKPEDPNELFQKLLEDLKELAEYDNSPSKDRPIYLNDNEEHSVQNKESLENSSKEIATSNSNEEKEGPPQDFDIHQLIEECSTEVSEEQKQSMEDTMLELVKICRKELLCIHDNIEDLIESALNSKLLSISSNSQRLDNKKQQEVKNVVEQPAERGNHSIEKSLQNFREIHKSYISFKKTSQISLIHAVAPILSTKEPEYSPSMGYENSNTTQKCLIFSDSNNVDDISVYNDDFEDIEYVEAPLPDPEIVNLEEENVVYHEEEEVDLEDISQIQDVVLREKLLSITRLIANIESLNDNPTPDCLLNSSVSIPISEESNNSLSDNFSPEFETFCDHTEKTRSGNTTTHADNSLPDDPLLEEADLFLASVNTIPPGIENFGYDPEGDIRFLEALLIDDSIPFPNNESSESDNSLIPLPPPEPPDAKPDSREVISVVINDIDEPNEDESFDPGGEIVVSTKDEDIDYFPFMFVMRIFLPYLIHPKVSPLFLSAESEDTIFDPGKDYAENAKNQSKTRQYQHKNGSQQPSHILMWFVAKLPASGKIYYIDSQLFPSSMDLLIKACEKTQDFLAVDVLEPDNEVERCLPNLKQQATAAQVDDDHFTDDYMTFVDDEKNSINYSLDDMDFEHEEEKVVVKEAVAEQLATDEFIDVRKEETTPLKEDVK